jgi:hypothetical protein
MEMTMTTRHMPRFAWYALFALCGSFLLLALRPAHAAGNVQQCVPTIIEYLPGQLIVQCPSPGGNNFAQTSSVIPSSCSSLAQNLDTIKAWVSLAQAALLAGKNVNIYSQRCPSSGGLDYITAIDLIR